MTLEYKENNLEDQKKQKRPSLIVFMFMQVFNSFVSLFTGIYMFFVTTIRSILTPWILPQIGMISNVILKDYFELIKKKDLPYLNPPPEIMAVTLGGNNSVKRKATKKVISDNGGKFKFYFKLFLSPFSLHDILFKELELFKEETKTYNDKFDEFFKSDDHEKISEAISKSVSTYKDLFEEEELAKFMSR